MHIHQHPLTLMNQPTHAYDHRSCPWIGRKRPMEAAVPPAVAPRMGPARPMPPFFALPAPPELPHHAGPPTTPGCRRRGQDGLPLADVSPHSYAVPEAARPDPAAAAAPVARIRAPSRSLPASSSSRWWLPLLHMLLVLKCLLPSPVSAQMYSIGADTVRGLNRGGACKKVGVLLLGRRRSGVWNAEGKRPLLACMQSGPGP